MTAALARANTFSQPMALGAQGWKTVFQKEKEEEGKQKKSARKNGTVDALPTAERSVPAQRQSTVKGCAVKRPVGIAGTGSGRPSVKPVHNLHGLKAAISCPGPAFTLCPAKDGLHLPRALGRPAQALWRCLNAWPGGRGGCRAGALLEPAAPAAPACSGAGALYVQKAWLSMAPYWTGHAASF